MNILRAIFHKQEPKQSGNGAQEELAADTEMMDLILSLAWHALAGWTSTALSLVVV
jgi:hypothetical protein